jgi:hypothetical protein
MINLLYVLSGCCLFRVIIRLMVRIRQTRLPPGAELDQIVSRKVFKLSTNSPPAYSLDASHAAKIASYLRSRGLRVALYPMEKNNRAIRVCVVESRAGVVSGWSDTAAHAICLAAVEVRAE